MDKELILFVEDREQQSLGVVIPLEATNIWNVKTCKSPSDALRFLEDISKQGALPGVVSIDLGLEPRPREAEVGIQLLKDIRERWEGLPIVVHSTIEVKESIVRTIVANGASYFYLFDESDVKSYIILLTFIAQGYLIYSPTPATRLPQIISVKPDPFQKNPEIWKTLELLAQGLTYSRIAERLFVGERAIMARVRKAATVLDALNEIELNTDSEDANTERYKPLVIEWYRNNKYKFGY